MIKSFYSIISSFLLISALSTSAQIVLTRASFPQIGDIQSYNLYDTTGINEGGNGSGQTWDFSQLGNPTISIQTAYDKPSDTRNGGLFPASTIAQSDPTVDNGYSYALLNDSEYSTLGATLYQQGGETTVKYTNAQKAISFPFSLNSVVSDEFEGKVTSSISSYETDRSGHTSVKGDGTGTLILPGGNQLNALRTRADQTVHDITDFDFYKSYIKTTTTSYSWYVSDFKGPIMTIHHIVMESSMIIGLDTISSGVMISKSVLAHVPGVAGVQEEFLKGDQFTFSPNPAEDHLALVLNMKKSSNVEINLKTIQGIKIRSIYYGTSHPGLNQLDVDLSGEKAGIYLLEVTADDRKAYRRFIKR